MSVVFYVVSCTWVLSSVFSLWVSLRVDMAASSWLWGWGKAYCHLLRPDPEGTLQVRTYGPRDCCQYSWQPFWGVLCREHHACISARPFCLSPLDAFLNALILENMFCVDLFLSLCLSAFVHCNGPEASWQSMMRKVLGIRKGWV